MWRGERGAKPSAAAEVVVPPPAPTSVPDSVEVAVDQSALRRVERQLAECKEELKQSKEEQSTLQVRFAEALAESEKRSVEADEFEAEARCREEAVEAVYAEGKRAREQVAELIAQVSALESERSSRAAEVEAALAAQVEAEKERDAAVEAAEKSSRSASQLLREIQQKNETVRRLRVDAAAHRPAPAPVVTAVEISKPETPSQRQFSSIPVWMTWRRVRVAMVFVFAVVMMVGGMVQSVSITEVSGGNLAQELRDCRRMRAAAVSN
eukprot:TRINITY_DN11054_c0_g1_i1.p1 TRINITY_DN11054_c0_g1~~TRINITY_DN11054_c0_g1_i1.p1  ORF type:complete len:267 (+),score=89.08 TRINITY_DN11054_c0_g1_i1:836-1636(+)